MLKSTRYTHLQSSNTLHKMLSQPGFHPTSHEKTSENILSHVRPQTHRSKFTVLWNIHLMLLWHLAMPNQHSMAVFARCEQHIHAKILLPVFAHPKMFIHRLWLRECRSVQHNHTGNAPMQMSTLQNSIMTVTDHVSQKGNLLRWNIHLMWWSPRGSQTHNLSPPGPPKRALWGGEASIHCQRAQSIALMAIFSCANTNRSTLCMSVGFTAAVQLQPYPQNGHCVYPKQMCLSRVLREPTIFVTCCQVLKRLL